MLELKKKSKSNKANFLVQRKITLTNLVLLTHNKKKLGRGHLGDVTHQISKLYAFQFQRRRILKFAVCFYVPTYDSTGWGQFLDSMNERREKIIKETVYKWCFSFL